MFTPGFDPMLQYKQRHQELIQEAQSYRMVKEALKAKAPTTWNAAHILASFGKRLVALGTQLESRYGSQPCPETTLSKQGSGI